MSKWFRDGSDDESESEDSSQISTSESESDSDDNQANRFLQSDSSDSDDDQRVVVSQKQRTLDELKKCSTQIQNKLEINDWKSVVDYWVEQQKQLTKLHKLQMGRAITTPIMYVRTVVQLEDAVAAVSRQQAKSMNRDNARAHTKMKQEMKKLSPQTLASMSQFRENPVHEGEEEEDDSDFDEEDDGKKGQEGDEEDKGAQEGRAKDKILTMKPEEVQYDMVYKKLEETVNSRGKRGSREKKEQVLILKHLSACSKGPCQKVEVLGQLVSFLFDMMPMAQQLPVAIWRQAVHYLLEVLQIVEANPNLVIDESVEIDYERQAEPPAGQQVLWGSMAAFIERLDEEMFKALQVADPHMNEYLDRLKDDTYFLALAKGVIDYQARVQSYGQLARVTSRLIEHVYYKTADVYRSTRESLMKLLAAQAEADAAAAATAGEETEAEGAPGENGDAADAGTTIQLRLPEGFDIPEHVSDFMDQLVELVYIHGDSTLKARAMLCHVYHLCIHDRFYEARDKLLMGHLQTTVQQSDISTQILYNRTMAQLGLCAFRDGKIHLSYQALAELYGSGKIRELLAQGINMSKNIERTPEQEHAERRRKMPFHMHINPEILEASHLISTMLLEIPYIASNTLDPRRKQAAKHFYRYLDEYVKKPYKGTPESVRDHVMAASNALMQGDWATCYGYVQSLDCWKLLSNKTKVLATLKEKVQEEALRTYLFSYGHQYTSVSEELLCKQFDLTVPKVRRTLCRMIDYDEIAASLDEPTGSIVVHRGDTTPLQQAAMSFMDKAEVLLQLNEHALGIQTGTVREEDDRPGQSDMYSRGPRNRGFKNSLQGFNPGRGRGRGSYQRYSNYGGGRQRDSHRNIGAGGMHKLGGGPGGGRRFAHAGPGGGGRGGTWSGGRQGPRPIRDYGDGRD